MKLTCALICGLTMLFLSLVSVSSSQRSKSSQPQSQPQWDVQTGLASFYGERLERGRTASGRTFDPDHLVAAHPSYPAGTTVRVTNLENGRSVDVRIIDRGPSRSNRREGVIIDLSRRAAERLGFKKDGRARVRTEVLRWGR